MKRKAKAPKRKENPQYLMKTHHMKRKTVFATFVLKNGKDVKMPIR